MASILQKNLLFHRRRCVSRKAARRKLGRRYRRTSKRSETIGDKKVNDFRKWCTAVGGITLNPKLYIGCVGSCSGIGVVANENISAGEELALIPRSALLTATSGVAKAAMLDDPELLMQLTDKPSWIPLVLSIIAEINQQIKDKSRWEPYINVVSNNTNNDPPLLWSESERKRLLSGMGVDQLVNRDIKLIAADYHSIAEPFMKRHPDVYSENMISRQIYEQVTSLVMAYSFTDAVEPVKECALSAHNLTMMVPFVDLLNHHYNHHAELSFHPECLRLVAIRQIHKGEEVMNTYGELPNYSLLHVYGFTLKDNPHDAACVSKTALRTVYLNAVKDEDEMSQKKKRWRILERQDLLPDEFEVTYTGEIETDLLIAVRLLLASAKEFKKLTNMLYSPEKQTAPEISHIPQSVSDLSTVEKEFLKRLALWCASCLPEDFSLCKYVSALRWKLLNSKEQAALQLCLSQHCCFAALSDLTTRSR